MAQSPVTLEEFRAHLQLEPGEEPEDDGERWGKVLAATGLIEGKVGAIRPRSVTERCRESGGGIELGNGPVLSVASVVSVGGSTSYAVDDLDLDLDAGLIFRAGGYGLPCGDYTVTYTIGRNPIPPELMEAVLVVAAQLWESQRGPGATNRFTGMGGDEQPIYRGFAWPNRAKQLIGPYRGDGLVLA